MSVSVIDPKDGKTIYYSEEEYRQAITEAADWQRALENAVEVPAELVVAERGRGR